MPYLRRWSPWTLPIAGLAVDPGTPAARAGPVRKQSLRRCLSLNSRDEGVQDSKNPREERSPPGSERDKRGSRMMRSTVKETSGHGLLEMGG